MKKSCLFTLVFIFSAVLNAQTVDELLAKTEQLFQSETIAKLDITLELPSRTISDLGKQKEIGELYIQGKKYYLILGDIELLSDGEFLYTINHSDQEVMKSKENEQVSENPVALFHHLRKNFKLERDIDKPSGGYTLKYVKLTPQKDHKRIKNYYLGFHSKTKLLHEILFLDKEERTTRTFFTKTTLSPEGITSSFFTFEKKKYGNYYILDLTE